MGSQATLATRLFNYAMWRLQERNMEGMSALLSEAASYAPDVKTLASFATAATRGMAMQRLIGHLDIKAQDQLKAVVKDICERGLAGVKSAATEIDGSAIAELCV